MIERFEQLSVEEFNQLKESIALITILIAGADGDIEEKELDWAEKITKIRSYASSEKLNTFYSSVGVNFDEQLSGFIDALPVGTNERTEKISKRLAALNPILSKLDPELRYELYTSFVSFAEHVAKASGGFMRFFSVSKEEKSLMGLPMLDPVEAPVDEENEG